jgi:hypothetical protein
VVIRTPTSNREQTTNDAEYWRTVVDLAVYDETREKCEAHNKIIRAILDVELPTLAAADGHILSARCVVDNVTHEDREVWRGDLTYQYLRRKPRAD